ncbi:MAG: hypothetical protein GF341_03475 [candidate division Zixibacteria bacterium]|nr:hypothetical protein [candidate division Zixibacteria bacterium]
MVAPILLVWIVVSCSDNPSSSGDEAFEGIRIPDYVAGIWNVDRTLYNCWRDGGTVEHIRTWRDTLCTGDLIFSPGYIYRFWSEITGAERADYLTLDLDSTLVIRAADSALDVWSVAQMTSRNYCYTIELQIQTALSSDTWKLYHTVTYVISDSVCGPTPDTMRLCVVYEDFYRRVEDDSIARIERAHH